MTGSETHYVTADNIYCTLGSPWVPSSYIEDFINYLILSYSKMRSHVEYDTTLKMWFVGDKVKFQGRLAATTTYGTKRMNAINIIEKMLNMQAPVVYDLKPSPINPGNTVMVLNKEETLAASEKAKMILSEFRRWIFLDPERRESLERIYNNTFVTSVKKHTVSTDFKPEGLNKDITLYPYQLSAAQRIINSPTVLLAHDVGAGKTYAMIVGGMELRRRGISKKNLYVVPNNIVWQWQMGFEQLYPNARILVVEPKMFAPNKRQKVIEDMRDGDYDAIIIAYSSLDLIPISARFECEYLRAKIDVIKQAEIANATALTRLYKREEQIKRKLVRLEADLKKEDKNLIYFGDLHINTLFVDEAHNFKNINTESKSTGFYGLSKSGSTKCHDMQMRVFSVLKENKRGIVFASGTPVTNSITDMFAMQTYLQKDDLAKMDIDTFNNWIGTFGESKTDFQIDVDANGYCMRTSFAAFHNLGELASHFAKVADFHRLTDKKGIPHFDGYTDVVVERTDYQRAYMMRLSMRADAVRKREVQSDEDNLLKITTDGKKAALDLRLIDGYDFLEVQPKVKAAAEEIYKIWKAGAEEKLTQLVFCDISTPKEEFNMYSELKRLLVAKGVPEAEIAFAHDAVNEKAKAELMEATNNGDVRVLLGSTMKLGTGVNVQKKLYAVHHLDIPWRPSDMVQREGRILRQGNENASVKIFRYITEGSFDAYSWQILEQKQRFITQLLSNNLTCRSGEDVDETVLSYAEIKALAVGNPLIKNRVETFNELCKVTILQKRSEEARIEAETEMASLPPKIAECENNVKALRADAERVEQNAAKITQELQDFLDGKTQTAVYRGFNVELKGGDDMQVICINGEGKYTASYSGNASNAISAAHEFLAGLPGLLKNEEEKLDFLNSEVKDAENVLIATQNYGKQIETLTARLNEIDNDLGIKHFNS